MQRKGAEGGEDESDGAECQDGHGGRGGVGQHPDEHAGSGQEAALVGQYSESAGTKLVGDEREHHRALGGPVVGLEEGHGGQEE